MDNPANTPGEEWRPVEGWPYEVSNMGRIRRTTSTYGTHAGRILKASVKNSGYVEYILCRAGDRQSLKAHSLVCTAFHGPRPSGKQTRHLNGIKTDNRAQNLIWGSCAENIQDKFAHGTMPTGKSLHNAVLTEDMVKEIRRELRGAMLKHGKRPPTFVRMFAQKFNVSQGAVAWVVNNKSWKHVAA